MQNNTIHLRASAKAFSKIAMLLIEKDQLHKDIERGNLGGITMEELKLMYEGTKRELAVWNYIASLIEKNDE